MAKIPTMDELAKSVANEALDSFVLDEKTLREWIEQVKASRWISTKDKLPKDGKRVLVFIPYEYMNEYSVDVAIYSHWRDVWYIGDMMGRCGKKPTHWMPLPEPPKEGNSL